LDSDNLNRWLTFGANIAVLAGILLILIELNQNADLMQVQIHQARSDAHVADRMAMADSDHFLEARRKLEDAGGWQDLDSIENLSPLEARRIQEYLAARHQDYDNLFYQYQRGYLDEEFYEYRIARSIRVFAPWWQKLGIYESGNRRPSFQQEIDRALSGVDD
jgi:hypothetical protein